MSNNGQRPSAESLLAKLKEGERANLRVYIGAAPGVGKTYQMLEDAHALKRQGVDICVAVVEAHGRAETAALIGELERVPLRKIAYRGVTLAEMDVDAVIMRHPAIAVVDESVDTLRTRLRQGKIYGVEKIEQSLNNFFRKGNLSALRELALRQVAEDRRRKRTTTGSARAYNRRSSPTRCWSRWPRAAAP